MGSFKSAVSKYLSNIRGTSGPTIWQRDYFEHVIRNEVSLGRIRRYMAENPMRWAFDRENPAAVKPEMEDVW